MLDDEGILRHEWIWDQVKTGMVMGYYEHVTGPLMKEANGPTSTAVEGTPSNGGLQGHVKLLKKERQE